jgi:hydrogenase maturation protease
MAGRTVVLGVGNTLLSDEGAGVHVVERLRGQWPDLAGVDFLDGGTLSFTLAGPMADAAELGAPPGTLALYRDAEMDAYLGRGKRRSVHEVSLLDLLAIATLTEDLPSRRALIGIQPGAVDWGEAPTAEVAAAIPLACDMALDLIREWQR